jgi:O-antigen ligase
VTATAVRPVPAQAAAAVDRRPVVAPEVVRVVWTVLLLGTAATSVVYSVVTPRSSTGPLPLLAPLGAGPVKALQLLAAMVVVTIGAVALALALPVLRAPKWGAVTAVSLATLGTTVVVSAWCNGVKISLGLLALPVFALAVGWFPHPPVAFVERLVRRALRVVVGGSLAAAVVAPRWATDRLYRDSVIGLHSRLVGLAPHANSLGPLVVLLVALEAARAKRPTVPLALAGVALVWTQSKTSWVVLVLVALLWVARRATGPGGVAARLPVLAAAGVVAVTAVVGIGLLAPGRSTTKGNDTSETFTGRTAIWEVTLEVWQSSPVLGIGPRLWDDAMDRRYDDRIGFTAGHAHNQLIQTLGEAGIVGEAALLVALVALCVLAARADEATAGAAAAGVLIVVVTCFSEVPVRSIPFSTNFFLLVAVYALAMVGANASDHAG